MYKIKSKLFSITLFICIPFLVKAQEGAVKGVITSADKQPLHGAYVELKLNNRITMCRQDGTYQFSQLKPGTDTLIVSFVGMKPVKQVIQIGSATAEQLDFTLLETEHQLNEVVIRGNQSPNLRPVTIGKLPIKAMDLPQAVMTIPAEVIKNQQAQRLSDVVKNVNGVYMGTSRASTQETFFARGYSFSSTNMFKNGARINTGAMPEMSSLESVEVLKGGAAILYGNVSPGGILNMVTKKPKFDFGGEVSMRTGSFGLVKPAFDIYGPISKHVAYRLNTTYENANSFRDKVSSSRYYVNPSFVFQLGAKTELTVEGDYLNHNFTPDFGIGSLNNTAIADVPRSRFMGTDWQYNKTRQATTTASIKHNINEKWQVNGMVSGQYFSRDYYSVERIQADENGKWARPLGRMDRDEKYASAQFNVTGKFKTGKVEHLLLAGADAERYNAFSYNFDVQGKVYDTINLLDPNAYVQRTDIPLATRVSSLQTHTNRYGVYMQDLMSLTEKVKLLAGVRWSGEHIPAGITQFIGKDSSALSQSNDANAFSPRVGIVYKVTPDMSLFGSYSNSFFINTGTDIFSNPLPPSIIDQYEVGAKNVLFGGQLVVNLTAYKIINNNLAQTAQFDKDGNPNSDNRFKELTGQTTSNGFEIDITSQPLKGLTLIAGYSLNDMRYTKTPDTKGSYIEGERLVSTPAHTANGTAFFVFPNGKIKDLRLGLSGFYTGDRFGGWNNTIGQAQGYSRLIPVSGFFTMDFSAGYDIRNISLLVKLSNLTNTYNYYLHENYSANPIAPRQFTGTVSYTF